MKYAVIRTGGKQYKVKEGDIIEVEKLSDTQGETVHFNEVLLYTADGVPQIGTPLLANITVSGKVLNEVRGPKIRVAKFKAKARSRRVIGHRQTFTQVQIELIGQEGKKEAKSIEA